MDPAIAGEVTESRGLGLVEAEPATGAKPGITSWRTDVVAEVDGDDLTVIADEAMLNDPEVSRTGFDGDIETWEEHQRCRHRRSSPISCVSVLPGWSLRPAGIRSARSGGPPTSSESTRRHCGPG